MKKVSKMFLLMAALVGMGLFTACTNSDDPQNTYTYSSSVINRALSDDGVYFSQSTVSMTINLTDNTIVLSSAAVLDEDKSSVSFTTPELKLGNLADATSSGNVYTFAATTVSSNVTHLQGYLDWGTGMLWFTYIADDDRQVYSSTQLLYAYTTTSIAAEGKSPYKHTQSAYCMVVDEAGENCKLQIASLLDGSGATLSSLAEYEGLTFTPTTTGYKVKASKVSPVSGNYDLTNVDLWMDRQGRNIEGSFVCNGCTYTVSGTMFGESIN